MAKANETKIKTGRPSKYKKEFRVQAEKLCKKGFIDNEIADFFDVDVSTLNRWKVAHPEFHESLKESKKHSDSLVVDSLYNRALGFEVEEVKTEKCNSGEKVTVTTKKVIGDTTAQIFWLKNRQPELWRNNPEPTEEDKTGESLNITFNVAEPVKEVKVTKGES